MDALLADFALRLEADGLLVERNVPVGPTSADPDAAAVPAIDLVVREESGRRRLAVESDGPAYAALPSVRERDRMRAEQLGRLGWEHLRVWSTDIFRDPAREVARVRRVLQPEPSRAAARGAAEQRRAVRRLEESGPEQSGPAQSGPAQSGPAQSGLEQTSDDTDLGWACGDDPHDDWLRSHAPRTGTDVEPPGWSDPPGTRCARWL